MVLLFTLKLLSFTQSYVHAHTHTQGLFKQRFINMVPVVSLMTCGRLWLWKRSSLQCLVVKMRRRFYGLTSFLTCKEVRDIYLSDGRDYRLWHSTNLKGKSNMPNLSQGHTAIAGWKYLSIFYTALTTNDSRTFAIRAHSSSFVNLPPPN